MRIVVVGYNGTIGSAVTAALEEDHELVRVAHDRGDFVLDLGDHDQIREMYAAVGPVDGVVCAAGVARFAPLEELTEDDFQVAFRNKLMGQINLVRYGMGLGTQGPPPVRPGGSFTLISGDVSIHPEPKGSLAGLVSGALEAWCRGAGLELEGRWRVNVVSPRAVREALERWGMDPEPGIPAAEVAAQFRAFVEGEANGAVAFL